MYVYSAGQFNRTHTNGHRAGRVPFTVSEASLTLNRSTRHVQSCLIHSEFTMNIQVQVYSHQPSAARPPPTSLMERTHLSAISKKEETSD